jgi:hypothetical protein
MPLVDLKTNLKSLKYGFDQPNMGSSKEPFITKPIPDERLIDTPDFILRDGALRRGVEDISRLTKLFTTFRGLKFIANTNLLAAQNPKIPGAPRNIYSPLNTLAQVGVNAVGGHLNLLGETPIDLPNIDINLGNISFNIGGEKYDTLYKNSYSQASSNRLVLLQKSKIGESFIINGSLPPQAPVLFFGSSLIQGIASSIENIVNPTLSAAEKARANDYGVAVNDNTLILNYEGGAGAGITGLKTKIKRDSYTIGSEGYVPPVPIENGQNPKDLRKYQVGTKTIKYGKSIEDGEINATKYLGVSNLFPEVRTGINDNGDPVDINFGVKYPSNLKPTSTQLYPTYTDASQSREFKSNPNFTPNKYGNLDSDGDYASDKFNKKTTQLLNLSGSNEPPSDQLFSFYLQLINPDNPSGGEYLYWQAYVDTYSDQIGATVDSYSYVGYGYPYFKYKSFSREISLGFTLVASNEGQLLSIYSKLNKLYQNLAPNYSSDGYLRGNFAKLTFGNYLNNVPGIIKGFTLSPVFDGGFDLESGKQLSKVVKIDSFAFTPIADNDNSIINNSSTFISI